MRAHFLLGPAGSGKTWRCLEEIRAELKRAPDGPPLLLLAPKQATFQLERQLLESPDLAGYSRLQIVSFDRLANWLLETFATVPDLLDDEGRVMVLRALLAREQPALRVFRATARLPGFARQLSQLLREFQRHQLTPARLARLAERCTESAPLRDKLHDLHHLLRAYHEWLEQSQTQDGDQLLDLATGLVRDSSFVIRHSPFPIAGLWLDGFAEMTPQELDLLCAVLPFCRTASLAFCLDPQAADSQSWLSLWSTVRRTYLDCRQRIAALPGCEASVEELPRDPAHSRCRDSPTLAQLEANWTAPAASGSSTFQCRDVASESESVCSDETATMETATLECRATSTLHPASSIQHPPSPLRRCQCANPEAEATLAAREILRHVRAGGRFRDCAVILRTLDHHHTALRRVFTRYGIPFFLDRREPVAHHPLAELTRLALRTLAYGWQPDDLFGALKSGLVHDRDEDIDWLENLALAHGWRGAQWLEPLAIPEPKFNLPRAEHLRARLTAPIAKLAEQLNQNETDERMGTNESVPPHSLVPIRLSEAISGAQLAAALRSMWDTLAIESRLQAWDDALAREGDTPVPALAPPLHATVLRQMHEWLDNLERAFPASAPALPLREWIPILEAGLSSLSVGVIPPALDQVLIGTIDRSRNPELQLALILGLNEGIFPAPPTPPVLLTETERDLLAAHDTRLGLDPRAQIAHERYFAYIACTRSRSRLVLTCSAADTDGKPLHPSPILAHVQQLFPDLELEKVPPTHDWREAEHTEELLEPILRELAAASSPSAPSALQSLASLPALAPVITRWHEITAARAATRLSPGAVSQLYDTELRTSVSKLEQFAECPFKFFVAAGLGAEERKEFEVDHRERGSFIHRLLDEFHLRVAASGRRWRDLSLADAAALAARVGEDLLASPEFALFAADDSRRFAARSLIASAQRLLAALVGWMPGYAFDPVAVELGFGLPGSPLPAWRLALADGKVLSLRGRIDRVDLCRDEKSGETLAVVVDYKSSPKKLDALKVENGLQLQLLAYLNVLSSSRREEAPANAERGTRNAESSQSLLTSAAAALHPAGVFYIPLHGATGSTGERAEILSEDEAARRATYQHAGRFDFAHRALLDARPGGAASGQFKLRLNKDGGLIARGSDALPSAEFAALLTQVEANLRRLGEAIFAGEVAVSPVRVSASDKACDRCDYRAICRFDPWTQPFRALKQPAEQEAEA
ncbi:MAG: DNA helicase/exodeoxyribonuclease V subunit B [Limisphaerales bacterium]|nr:MAG: DNA helicase/exodeoxyribonuclease V subunit B [Limisphaerales bacterium]KAG0510172.1 MAG: DNA helicase/exodeoxyribonuclease V subunit B [Limisphaerales bacterium]TXT51945.1 MAG: DNA helicase/exodeoxyribonuclease V subunit B [Limisphaerales bacterium]